jgi:hypothetical protein
MCISQTRISGRADPAIIEQGNELVFEAARSMMLFLIVKG